jgi:predicted aldo/keto reductase-like oxidoreductase
MDLKEAKILGKTGLKVGRLGVAASYGAPTAAFEEAFERGCNYFYWGSMRKSGMRDAIRNISEKGRREDLVIAMQSYSRSAILMESFFKQGLKKAGLDHADVMILGWHNKRPSQRIMDRALSMKEKGLFRFLALSGHKRTLFPELAREKIFDIFHIRYNAAHRGAETDIFPHIEKNTVPGLVSYTATRWGQLLNPKKMPEGETPLRGSDCYRFALSHASVDVCMCGPKNHDQMKEALRTLDLGPLNDQEMERMHRIGDHLHAHAGRF